MSKRERAGSTIKAAVADPCRSVARLVVAALAAAACSGDASSPAQQNSLVVYGSDMSARYQNIWVSQGGVDVDDASVTVNGVTIPPVPGERGRYYGQLESWLPPGSQLTLNVVRAGLSVTAVGSVPASPVLTAPLDGATVPAASDVMVTWTSPSDPDRFSVSAGFSCGAGCNTAKYFDVPGSARSFVIPANSVTHGAIRISVFAYNSGSFTGDYAPNAGYPGMNIRADSSSVSISW